MPNFNEDEIIERLVVEFMVDDQKAEEAVRDSAAVLERQKDVAKEFRDLEKADFAASFDIQKDIQGRHFENQELALRAYYSRRMDLIRGNAEEERRVQQKLEEDLGRLQEKRDAVNAQIDETQQKSMGMSRNIGQIISGLGFGQLAGLASIAGVVAGIADATSSIREGHVVGGELAGAAGLGPEFAFPLAGRLRTIAQVSGIGLQQTQQIAGQFVPIAQPGEKGAASMARLTEEAGAMGLATGVDPTTIAKLMVQFRQLEQEELPDLTERFADMVKIADQANVPAGQFISWLTTANESLKMYNVSIFETANLVGRFARELTNGTMSIQQIVAGQKAVAQAPVGVQALIGEEALRGGGALAKFLRSRGATTASQAARAIRTLSEGGWITPEGNIRPATEEEEGEVAGYRQEAEAIVGRIIENWARQSGQTGFGLTDIRMAIQESMGLKLGNTEASNAQLFDAIFGKDAREGGEMLNDASKGFLEGTRHFASAAELIERGRKMQDEQISVQKEMWTGIASMFQAGVEDFNIAVRLLMGDEEMVEKLLAEKAAAEEEAFGGGRTRAWFGRALWNAITTTPMHGGAGGAPSIGTPYGRTTITLQDNTENNPVAVDAEPGENTITEALPGQGQ